MLEDYVNFVRLRTGDGPVTTAIYREYRMLRFSLLLCTAALASGFGLSPLSAMGKATQLSPKISAQRASSAGLLGLRSQMDKTKGWGWADRPPTSISGNDGVREDKARARISVTGSFTIQGADIMYDYLPGNGPAIMYLPALNRTRHGETATALKTWCRANNRAFLVADYFGVGASSGEYKDASISRWVTDSCTLIQWLEKEHGHEEVILVGAGVGGWVMLHAAQKMAKSVVGLVGQAADPDFITDLVMPSLGDDVKKKIMAGSSSFEWGGKTYELSKTMVEDSEEMNLLSKGRGSIPITCPVHLIQGLGDEEIPPEKALKISDSIKGDDVTVTYVKYGSHEMDEDEDFKRIYTALVDIDRQLGKANWARSIQSPV